MGRMTVHSGTKKTVILLLASFMSASQCYASSFEKYAAAMHEYLSNYIALPILSPNGEEPGDIYIDPYHGFIARRTLCFSAIAPKKNATALASFVRATRYSVAGELSADLYEVVQLSGEVGAQISNAVDFSFFDAEVAGYTENELEQMLNDSTAECATKLKDIFVRNLYPYQQQVPLILREVISARISSRLTFEHEIDARLVADVKANIAPFIDSPSASLAGSKFDSGGISLNTKEIFPIAYRPAFISLDDIERLKRLDDSGIWDLIKQALSIDQPPIQQLRAIQSKYPEVIVQPHLMYQQMSSGQPVIFNTMQDEHVLYLERRNKLLAASWEIFGEP